MLFISGKSAKPYDRPATAVRKVESSPDWNGFVSTKPIDDYDSEDDEVQNTSSSDPKEENEDKISFPLATLFRVRVIADFKPTEMLQAVEKLKEKAEVIFDDIEEIGDEFSGMYGLYDDNEDIEGFAREALGETPLVWSHTHQKSIDRNNVRWLPVLISYDNDYLFQLYEYNEHLGLMEDIEEAVHNIYGEEWSVLYDVHPEDSENLVAVRRVDNFAFHKSICHVHAEK